MRHYIIIFIRLPQLHQLGDLPQLVIVELVSFKKFDFTSQPPGEEVRLRLCPCAWLLCHYVPYLFRFEIERTHANWETRIIVDEIKNNVINLLIA